MPPKKKRQYSSIDTKSKVDNEHDHPLNTISINDGSTSDQKRRRTSDSKGIKLAIGDGGGNDGDHTIVTTTRSHSNTLEIIVSNSGATASVPTTVESIGKKEAVVDLERESPDGGNQVQPASSSSNNASLRSRQSGFSSGDVIEDGVDMAMSGRIASGVDCNDPMVRLYQNDQTHARRNVQQMKSNMVERNLSPNFDINQYSTRTGKGYPGQWEPLEQQIEQRDNCVDDTPQQQVSPINTRGGKKIRSWAQCNYFAFVILIMIAVASLWSQYFLMTNIDDRVFRLERSMNEMMATWHNFQKQPLSESTTDDIQSSSALPIMSVPVFKSKLPSDLTMRQFLEYLNQHSMHHTSKSVRLQFTPFSDNPGEERPAKGDSKVVVFVTYASTARIYPNLSELRHLYKSHGFRRLVLLCIMGHSADPTTFSHLEDDVFQQLPPQGMFPRDSFIFTPILWRPFSSTPLECDENIRSLENVIERMLV